MEYMIVNLPMSSSLAEGEINHFAEQGWNIICSLSEYRLILGRKFETGSPFGDGIHNTYGLETENYNLQKQLNEMKKFNPRAMKLMEKKKAFVVVAYDEPYLKEVYDLIRYNEMKEGRWTLDDESNYLDAIDKSLKV